VNFAVTSHKGTWREAGTTHFGWEHNAPLAARLIANKVDVPGKGAFFVGRQSGPLPPKEAATVTPSRPCDLQSLKMAEDGNGTSRASMRPKAARRTLPGRAR
jgi:hypothetical protein